MLKQTIHFTDYNDQPRTITEYFHLNEAEIVDMQAKSEFGIQDEMQNVILSNDAGKVLDFIKNLVHRSYGKKSADGLTFEKSPEILQRFINSAYYSDFLLGLIQDDGAKGQDFVKGIFPAKLVERALAQVQGQEVGPATTHNYQPDARETFAAAQAEQPRGTFGQPEYPQFAQPTPKAEPIPVSSENRLTPQYPAPMDSAEEAEFQAWLAQKRAAEATQTASAPASPDAFRVREADPEQGLLPRPPHEQIG